MRFVCQSGYRTASTSSVVILSTGKGESLAASLASVARHCWAWIGLRQEGSSEAIRCSAQAAKLEAPAERLLCFGLMGFSPFVIAWRASAAS